MSYIDWGYYSSHFPKLTEEEFDAALAGAEVKVEIYTHFRSRTATGYKLEQVKAAVANLINTMADQNSVGAGSGVTSTSNDGYSESYANHDKIYKKLKNAWELPKKLTEEEKHQNEEFERYFS